MTRKPSATPRPLYLIAEYCAGPFYMGWWMYLRERNNGSPNEDRWDNWGWLRCHCYDECRCQLRTAHDLCKSLGRDPPTPQRYSSDFAEWFAGEFPGGILVSQTEDGWESVEIVAELPKQVNRHIIRTVARAKRSFARACRERKKARTT